jgi:hypothetical protein
MLAEKFFLVLETLKRNSSYNGFVVSAASHIPVKLPLRGAQNAGRDVISVRNHRS